MRVSTSLALLCAASACGRLGFDESSVDNNPPAVDGGHVDALAPGADAAFCAESPCRLVAPQCGCAEGSMCQRTGASTDERSCIAAGTANPDETCSLDSQCVAGHACIAQTENSGRCHGYCEGDDDCPIGIDCADLVEGVGVGICGSACTLEAGCPTDTACKVVLAQDFDSEEPVALPLCAAPTGADAGAACGSSLDCGAGLFCESDVCRPLCRFDGTLACAAGTCTEALAPILLGGAEHGVCL